MEDKQNIFWVKADGEKKLATENLIPGNQVYNEKLVRSNGREYRTWNPFRSKLAAAIMNNLNIILIIVDSCSYQYSWLNSKEYMPLLYSRKKEFMNYNFHFSDLCLWGCYRPVFCNSLLSQMKRDQMKEIPTLIYSS